MTIETRKHGEWRRVRTLDAAGINGLSQGESAEIADLLRVHQDLRLVHDSGKILVDYSESFRAAVEEAGRGRGW